MNQKEKIICLSDYDIKVFTGIRNMPFDHPQELAVGNKYYEGFCDSVKKIMQAGMDLRRGYELEFNNDYTKIRKKKIKWGPE